MIREARVRLSFRYAAGQGAGAFLSALRDRAAILGARCPSCRKVWCPARSFCQACGADTEPPLEVGQAGRLESWTDTGSATYGLVRLDGADSAFLHRLLGPPRWRIGDRVRARFAARRVGSILDIAGFERDLARPTPPGALRS